MNSVANCRKPANTGWNRCGQFFSGRKKIGEIHGLRLVWLFTDISQDPDCFHLSGLHPPQWDFILVVARRLLQCIQISAGQRWEAKGYGTFSKKGFSFLLSKGLLSQPFPWKFISLPKTMAATLGYKGCLAIALLASNEKKTGQSQRLTFSFLKLILTTSSLILSSTDLTSAGCREGLTIWSLPPLLSGTNYAVRISESFFKRSFSFGAAFRWSLALKKYYDLINYHDCGSGCLHFFPFWCCTFLLLFLTLWFGSDPGPLPVIR